MNNLFKIKYKLIISCLCIVIGCSHAPYRYSFSLIDPQSETMSFEDQDVHFSFIPSAENIQVVIKNKSDCNIDLIRDKAEFIDHIGESYIIHYGYDYVSEVRSYKSNLRYATPMRIRPGTEIMGHVWINDWPHFLLGEGPDHSPMSAYNIDNLKEPLFPRYSFEGKGKALKGSTFKLILPIDCDGKITSYDFTFMINDVMK
ncbi:arylsulfatase A and related enzymes [Candidatus Scalindua japonica]|uniref:Arylsulfatase A and related enzymes n=1 Tax=Candidatus Scalindua japonica TaxID=1284222 RepID=A0A286TXE4_9BACT|nr:hypothetical protein [Candidatus Scalindua japonica]GAX60563.1 arylsulfatase A and related enzymes [Candidatus Scalindua japonica]